MNMHADDVRWDLSEFYSDIKDKQIIADLERLNTLTNDFRLKYRNKIVNSDALFLKNALSDYCDIVDLESVILSYVSLVRATAIDNEEVSMVYQNAMEKANSAILLTTFFYIEINKKTDESIKEFLSLDSETVKYDNFMKRVRAYKPYQLSEDMEELIADRSTTAAESWIRLFVDTMADLRFPMNGEMLIESEIMAKMASNNAVIRKESSEVFGSVLKDNVKIFARITNVLSKDREIREKARKFPSIMSSRNIANNIEDHIVDTLISSVKSSYSSLSHRYYKLKCEIFGCEKLSFWNRDIPYMKEEKKMPWKDACNIVLDAYYDFSDTVGDIAKMFFDKRWIDASVYKGKDSGAFSCSTATSKTPRILMNYQGKRRDIATLAHELGHGIHQYLARVNGPLLSSTPLTLAETASVFGEQLTFRKMLDRESDNLGKCVMIASKVEDMLNTVVRQIAFCEFEIRLHKRRLNGELSVDEICDIWFSTIQESLGSSIELTENYRYFWTYIPHFVHTPFYVYSYAFGECLVNSLYQRYLDGMDGFVEKYIDLLKSGGSKGYKELLSGFDLDPGKSNFWLSGLEMIVGFIDTLEKNASFMKDNITNKI